MWEAFLALISLIAGAAISQSQMEDQNSRAAHDTQVRSWFNAIKDRFNLSIDQLNQFANRVDIDLDRLSNAARGSARLAKASKIYRDYVQKYPDRIQKINQTKNIIQQASNNLSALQEEVSAKIAKGASYNKRDVASKTQQEVMNVNSAIGDLNNNFESSQGKKLDEGPSVENIDTELKEIPKSNVNLQNAPSGDAYYYDSRRRHTRTH